MTSEQINEINQKVAQALITKDLSLTMPYPWSPASSWEAAMWAAEQAGLFTNKKIFSLGKSSQGEEFWVCRIGLASRGHFAPTGPLAICQAILANPEKPLGN
jgi:hypothetical protein